MLHFVFHAIAETLCLLISQNKHMLPAEPTHTKASFITPDCKLLNDKIPDDNYHSQQKPLRLKMSPSDFIKVMGRLGKKKWVAVIG